MQTLLESEESDARSLRQSHVLVVEDERHIARLLDHVLRKEGYAVSTVYNAEHALEFIRENAPDALLLDIVLPGMSGLDLLREVRQNSAWSDLVIIVLSGQWFTQDDPTLADAGATAQCPKPIAPSKLIRKLEECGISPRRSGSSRLPSGHKGA